MAPAVLAPAPRALLSLLPCTPGVGQDVVITVDRRTHPWGVGCSVSFLCVCVCRGGLHPWHMEVPRLGVQLELQLLAYTTATAMPALSRICNSHHSLWQHRILNPLRGTRGRTSILVDTSRILNRLSHNRSSCLSSEDAVQGLKESQAGTAAVASLGSHF